MSGLFVTATDTGVGKTIVAAGLAAAWREQGRRIGVYKPIQSGHLLDDPMGDAWRLKALSGVASPLERICPYAVAEPLAPRLALERAGRKARISDIQRGYAALRAEYETVIVEGAGGLAVPYTEDGLVVDAIAALRLPIVIVSRPNLGAINHTLLTIDYARERGISIIGFILCGMGQTTVGVAERTNAQYIERHGRVPFLGALPWLEDMTREKLREATVAHLDLQTIQRGINDGPGALEN